MDLEKTAAKLKAEVKQTEEHGPRTRFTQGFKAREVNYFRQRTAQGASLGAVAAELGLSDRMVSRAPA
jgi:hypothetical protein